MIWALSILLIATLLGGVFGFATLVRIAAAWRDYRRERAAGAHGEPADPAARDAHRSDGARR